MSTSPQIDYDAIARQHGGSESTNSSAQVDYDSLAAQHGGKASTPKLTENGREIPEGGFGVGHYLKEQMPDRKSVV